MIYYLPVPPQPCARPRFSRGRTYNTAKYSAYKTSLQTFLRALHVAPPCMGALKVEIDFHMRQPKKHGKYPAVRPDLDNLIKAILDAGNDLLWRDDGQIVSIYAHKRYSKQPGIQICLTPIKE